MSILPHHHLLSVIGLEKVSFTYTNWKGETEQRRASMLGLYWGSNEWHKDEQWLVLGHDLDKNEGRTYALKDISDVKMIEDDHPEPNVEHPIYRRRQLSIRTRFINELAKHLPDDWLKNANAKDRNDFKIKMTTSDTIGVIVDLLAFAAESLIIEETGALDRARPKE